MRSLFSLLFFSMCLYIYIFLDAWGKNITAKTQEGQKMWASP